LIVDLYFIINENIKGCAKSVISADRFWVEPTVKITLTVEEYTHLIHLC